MQQLNANQLKQIANQMKIDIDNYCDKKWGDENRKHLGFSLIGDDCRRKLWYGFRWCKKPKPEPRVKRLFDRGHKEEERFVDYLRGIGCIVEPFDPKWRLLYDSHTNSYLVTEIDNLKPDMLATDVSDNAEHIKRANEQGITYPVQWRVSAVWGHSGGSMDGKGYLPERYGIKEQVLFEFKTHNDKSYKKLDLETMQRSKPLHYSQVCGYGYLEKINYVVYVAVNKNDDDLYIEIKPLNHKTGELMVVKAQEIIVAKEPPPKLHENPTFYICKMCDYFPICHANAPIDRNCRSCKHAEPAKDKNWICNKHQQLLTDEIIVNEYGCWESII